MLGIIALQAAASWWGYETKAVFIAQCCLLLAALTISIWRLKHAGDDMRRFFLNVSGKLDTPHSDLLTRFPLPVLILHGDRDIIWYSDSFRNHVLDGEELFGTQARDFLSEAELERLDDVGYADVELGQRYYTVYQSLQESGGEQNRILYFVDITALKTAANAYERSRPSVLLIVIDSLEEMTSNLPESEQAAIRSAIDREIESWAAQTSGFLRRIANERYLMVTDEQSVTQMIAQRFDILDRVRSLTFEGHTGTATLSIGVGRCGDTLKECESMARQALDMALGRGGDQAAVKQSNSFEFYGGVSSKNVEKRTKVRTRVIASALRELIEGSDNVLIMGHRFSDLDCLGASFGMWRAVHEFGRNCRIVMTKNQTLAGQLLERMEKQGLGEMVLEPEDAIPLITRKTLLIIMDTHRAEFLDSPAVYEKSPAVVVIDHHRKTVDYIDNAVIFYHEPYASSACEMVSELLQYMGERLIGRAEADALLAGIMLDTRNFVLRTGVRTFEASAYLRSRGADPVEVKRMFAGSMEVYRERSAVVAAAEIYGNCAISVDEESCGTTRVAAAQAADELLSIENVDASFVIFKTDGTVNVSARSLGNVNVQLIMEILGGGGHFTMAAAQLKDIDCHDAKAKVIGAIEQYNKAQEKAKNTSQV